jgi:hypothetical protein
MAPKPPFPKALYVPVDVWTLRCLYNRSDYADQIASGAFIELLRETFNPQPDGSKTVQVYYGTESPRFSMVRLQWFEGRNGEILRSGLKDPKQMYAELRQRRIDCHTHKGDTKWQKIRKEPERLFEGNVLMQQAYGRWRTRKCSLVGPIEAYRIAWWRASFPRAWFVAASFGAEWVAARPRRIARQYRIWRNSRRGGGRL